MGWKILDPTCSCSLSASHALSLHKTGFGARLTYSLTQEIRPTLLQSCVHQSPSHSRCLAGSPSCPRWHRSGSACPSGEKSVAAARRGSGRRSWCCLCQRHSESHPQASGSPSAPRCPSLHPGTSRCASWRKERKQAAHVSGRDGSLHDL